MLEIRQVDTLERENRKSPLALGSAAGLSQFTREGKSVTQHKRFKCFYKCICTARPAARKTFIPNNNCYSLMLGIHFNLFNPLQHIVPKVDSVLCDDKCNFLNHFEMAIFLS